MSQVDQEALATMHLNSSVYELMEGKDGDTKPLFKQENNTLLVKGICIERRINESCEEIWESIEQLFNCPPDMKKMALYPIEYMNKEAKGNYTVAYGWLVDYEKADPNKPISVMTPTPEKIEEVRADALTAKPVVHPFVLAIPETDRYMFSLSLDHVPAEAVVPYVEGAENADESIPGTGEESDAPSAQ